MATLSELQAVVHGVLREETSVSAGAERLGVDPARLDIYRRFVKQHIRSVLDKDYPALRSTLPPAIWDELTAGFYADRPATHFELNACVAGLPAYLSERLDDGGAGLEPAHVALAQFEWHEFAAYAHPARIPDRRVLDRSVLNPTLLIVSLACPVIDFMVAWGRSKQHDPGVPLPGLGNGSEVVLFFRHPETGHAAWHKAVDDLLFAIKVAHEGLDPSEAARRAGLPAHAALAAWRRAEAIGLVLSPG
jgi:hypothetical protein